MLISHRTRREHSIFFINRLSNAVFSVLSVNSVRANKGAKVGIIYELKAK